MIQQEINQLRSQFLQDLDSRTQLIHQQMGIVTSNLNERLKENSEILQKSQQGLGERLDNAARVVGNVQKVWGALRRRTARSMRWARISLHCKIFYAPQS